MIFKINGTTIGIIDAFPKGATKEQTEHFSKQRFANHLDLIEIESVMFEKDKYINFEGKPKGT